MTTYYISGPMRGKPRHNADQFNAVERELKYCKLDGTAFDRVINPSSNFGGDQSREPNEYMTVDLQQVLESDVVVLLPGWTESEGARREVQVATWTGKKFLAARSIGCEHNESSLTDHWVFEDIDVSVPTETRSVRQEMLYEASGLVTGDRNNTYGPPWQDFMRSAGALNAMGYRGPDGKPLEAHDIAILVLMIKVSRLMWTPAKRDSWVDIAGYAACGLECAIHEDDERQKAMADIEEAKAEFKAAVNKSAWSGGWEDYKDWGDAA